DRASQHELALLGPLVPRGTGGRLEPRLNASCLRARAHKRRGRPGTEGKVEVPDHTQIADVELPKHGLYAGRSIPDGLPAGRSSRTTVATEGRSSRTTAATEPGSPPGSPNFSRTRAWNGGASSRRISLPGFGAAPIRTLEPTGSSRLSRPSADRSPSSSPTTLRVTRSLADRTSDRSNTMCAATGVTIRQRRVGVTMGPPAEKE